MGAGPVLPWLQRLLDASAGDRAELAAAAPAPWRAALVELIAGPEPDDALLRALGLPEAVRTEPWPATLGRLLHEGGYVARLLTLDPGGLAVLSDDARRPDLRAALRAAQARYSLDEALGRVRTREYLRIARREVEGAPLEEVGRDLSQLAAACVQTLLETLGLADTVVVFGMGKLGGEELNFLSDIDLVFVHDDALAEDEGARRGAVVKLHDGLRQLVRHLEGQGRWRPLFRVDLRLRPFGGRGPLSTSMTATEAYYERHGRPWERQVWLRAHPIAGRLDLGEALISRLTPFVYRRAVGPEIFAEIADMMRRARREAGRSTTGVDAIDLKLDAGGIREVEFTAQALQLLHGGRNPGVRSTSTLKALDRLLAAGLVSDREHRELGAAYRWLRRVEHRVQLAEGQQTHRVPAEAEARSRLARRLAWPRDDLAAFETALADHRARVQAIAQTIAGDETSEDPRERALDVVLDEGAPRPERCAALERLGAHDPPDVEARLEHLYTRPDGPFAARGRARQGAENLLRACLDSADPDAAIARLVELAASRPAHYGIWRAFAEPGAAGLDLLRLTGSFWVRASRSAAASSGSRPAVPPDPRAPPPRPIAASPCSSTPPSPACPMGPAWSRISAVRRPTPAGSMPPCSTSSTSSSSGWASRIWAAGPIPCGSAG